MQPSLGSSFLTLSTGFLQGTFPAEQLNDCTYPGPRSVGFLLRICICWHSWCRAFQGGPNRPLLLDGFPGVKAHTSGLTNTYCKHCRDLCCMSGRNWRQNKLRPKSSFPSSCGAHQRRQPVRGLLGRVCFEYAWESRRQQLQRWIFNN